MFRSPLLFADVRSTRATFPEHHLFVRVVSGLDVGDDGREICTGLKSFPTPLCEHWLSPQPLQRGRADDLRYAYNDQVMFGWFPVCAGTEAEYAAETAYAQMLGVADAAGFPYFARIWHYLPDLNGEEHGVSRYRAFCRGRRRVLAGQLERGLCAATVIGTLTRGSMIFIASREPGRAIENPRQMRAADYPIYNGAEKPLFSRAMQLPRVGLFVSGTASIVGSESAHAGRTLAEFGEILSNLESLLRAANKGDERAISYMKIYLADERKRPEIQSELARRGLDFPVAYSCGGICRPELTIEVEAAVACTHA